MAARFQTEYRFDTNTLVVLKHPNGRFLRVDPYNEQQLDGDGGTGEYARWNIQICDQQDGFKIVKLKHSLTGKYLRIYNNNGGHGLSMDVGGAGGKWTKFKLHVISSNSAKLESYELSGKYPAVTPKGVFIGNGGKWTEFKFFKQETSKKVNLEQMMGMEQTGIEQLQQRLQKLEEENKALQTENKSLHEEIEYLAEGTFVNDAQYQVRHSPAFWDDIRAKLRGDTVAIKNLIKNGTITMKDIEDTIGNTLMNMAASSGNYEIVQLCINLGADMEYQNDAGRNALTIAQATRSHHVQQLLLLNEINANIGDKIKNMASNINKQNGIIENVMNEIKEYDETTREFFKDILMDIMIKIIRKKRAFSDDLLNFCWTMCMMDGGDVFESELWECIESMCLDVIGGHNKRDWYYLKTYIIPSNIWYTNMNLKGADKKKTYLYYKLLSLVEKESETQLNKLKENIKKDAAKDEEGGFWEKLIKWNVEKGKLVELKGNNNNNNTADDAEKLTPRQDNIPNGLIAKYTKKQLNESATNTSFDGAVFYDHHQYLSNLSLLAQTVDAEFQKSIQKIFNVNKATNIGIIKIENNDNEKEEKYDCKQILIEYNRGPVKLLQRAQDKAENDYFMESYPTSACVLDFNRCALIFGDIKELLFALNLFVNKIRSYEADSIIGIVRVKNGFVEYVKEAQYADIKVNVLIRGNTNNIVGEVQFLLKTMKYYKNIAHNLYAITREEEFISQSVSKLLPPLIDLDQQTKVAASLGDVKSLCKIMVNQNKTIKDLSFIDQQSQSILVPICKYGNIKGFRLIKGLMDKEQFINHLFSMKGAWSTPIEKAIEFNKALILKEIFNIDDVVKEYKNDQWIFRAIYIAFSLATSDTIDLLIELLNLSQNKLIKIFNYQYPDKRSNFYKRKLIPKMMMNNSIEIIKKLCHIMGENEFTANVFKSGGQNTNGIEMAIYCHKVHVLKYFMSIKTVKQQCMNNKNIRWRIIYRMHKDIAKKQTINYIINELQFTRQSLTKLISYSYPKPNDTSHLDPDSYKYWKLKIPQQVIHKFLTS